MAHHTEYISSMVCLDCQHSVADHRAHDRFSTPKFYPGKKVCIARGCSCREFREPHKPKIMVTV